MDTLFAQLPQDLVGFVLALALGLLIGIEREEHEPRGLGGIRTFPLIALAGYLLTRGFPGSTVPVALGLVVLGALVTLSHWPHVRAGEIGITTEVATLLTFALGAVIAAGLYWVAIATGVVTVILLQEKMRLEALATRLPAEELRTLLRFLLLTGVILPTVPNQAYTRFHINPFTIWLVVVAVSGISYVSYLLQVHWKRGPGLLVAGLLGGAYSSTVTTVVLARKSKEARYPDLGYVGPMVAATGMMYLRLLVLMALFAPSLARPLTFLFAGLGGFTILLGLVLGRAHLHRGGTKQQSMVGERVGNPLELTSAFTFAGIFLAVLVVTRLVAERFGGTGVLIMAAVMGAADVDPFILGLTQYTTLDLGTAALAVVVAAATNNLMKGVYAAAFGTRRVGRLTLLILSLIGAGSVVLYLFV